MGGDLFMLDLANNDFGHVRRGEKLVEAFGRAARLDRIAAAVAFGFRQGAGRSDRNGAPGRRGLARSTEVHLSRDQLRDILRAVRVAGVGTIVMPRNPEAVAACAAFDIDSWKLASDDLRDDDVIAALAETNRAVMVAADRASLDDIEALVASMTARGFAYTFKHAVSVHPDPGGPGLVPQRKARLVIVFTPPSAAGLWETVS